MWGALWLQRAYINYAQEWLIAVDNKYQHEQIVCRNHTDKMLEQFLLTL